MANTASLSSSVIAWSERASSIPTSTPTTASYIHSPVYPARVASEGGGIAPEDPVQSVLSWGGPLPDVLVRVSPLPRLLRLSQLQDQVVGLISIA